MSILILRNDKRLILVKYLPEFKVVKEYKLPSSFKFGEKSNKIQVIQQCK